MTDHKQSIEREAEERERAETILREEFNMLFTYQQFDVYLPKLIKAMQRYAAATPAYAGASRSDGEKWVSVEDRLPEKNQIVLAIISTYKQPLLCKYVVGKFERYTDYCAQDRIMVFHYPDVTYWRELPSPPHPSEIKGEQQ